MYCWTRRLLAIWKRQQPRKWNRLLLCWAAQISRRTTTHLKKPIQEICVDVGLGDLQGWGLFQVVALVLLQFLRRKVTALLDKLITIRKNGADKEVAEVTISWSDAEKRLRQLRKNIAAA